MTLTVDNGLVDTSRCDTVIACGVNTSKTLIMAQVEIGLKTVLGHIALPMLVWIKSSRVDVYIGVELLDGNLITACLK